MSTVDSLILPAFTFYSKEQNQKRNRMNWIWFVLLIMDSMNPKVSKEVYHLKPACGSWEYTVNMADPFDFAFDLKGRVAEKSSEKIDRAWLCSQ